MDESEGTSSVLFGHTYEYHLDCLNKLCRTCGGRTQSKKAKHFKPVLCSDYHANVFTCFGVNIHNDLYGTHGLYLCSKCYRRMHRVSQNFSERSTETGRQLVDSSKSIWCEYNSACATNECSVCYHFSQTCCGSIRKSIKTSTASVNPESVCSDLCMSPNQPGSDEVDGKYSETETGLVKSPIKLTSTLTPGTVTSPIETSTYEEIITTATSLLETDDTYGKIISTATSPIKRNDFKVPLSKSEEVEFTNYVRRKFATTEQKGRIICRTGGKPFYLCKVPQCRKQTTYVKSPTRRKRAKLMQTFRQSVAGTSSDSLEMQQGYEIKQFGKTSCSNISRHAGVKVSISNQDTLAIKIDLGLSDSQIQKLRCHLQQAGLSTNRVSKKMCQRCNERLGAC